MDTSTLDRPHLTESGPFCLCTSLLSPHKQSHAGIFKGLFLQPPLDNNLMLALMQPCDVLMVVGLPRGRQEEDITYLKLSCSRIRRKNRNVKEELKTKHLYFVFSQPISDQINTNKQKPTLTKPLYSLIIIITFLTIAFVFSFDSRSVSWSRLQRTGGRHAPSNGLEKGQALPR